MIGDEGGGGVGGKMRPRANRSGAKPYDRPQSILNRVGNVVRGVLTPSSWLSSLTRSQETAADECVVESHEGVVRSASENERLSNNRILATSRSALNSTTVAVRGDSVDSHRIIGNENGMAITTRHRVPLLDDGKASTSVWSSASATVNDDHHVHNYNNPPGSLSVSTLRDMDDGAIASTSTSFASPANPVGASSSSRRNFAADETGQRRREPSTSNRYARLCDIGRLSNDLSSKRYSESSSKIDGRDSQSECSDESVSTSGCSSMVPHPDKRDYQREILELSQPALRQLTTDLSSLQRSLQSNVDNGGGGGGSVGGLQFDANTTDVAANASESAHSSRLQDRLATGSAPSFLFSENSSLYRAKPQPLPATNKPQFNSFLFGSPALPKKYDVKKNNRVCSMYPFGNKVSYGFGSTTPSSSYRASGLNSVAPYSTAARRQIQVKPAKTSGSEVMSATTKKILETLEKMSTPVMDAKRIPVSKPDMVLDTPLTFTTTAYRRRPNLSMKTPSNIARIEATYSGVTPRGPPVDKLMIPGSMATTRTYLRNVEMSAAAAQPSSSASPAVSMASKTNSQASQHWEGSATQTSAPGKMRVPHQNASHYSRAMREEQPPEPPPLPPSVPLVVNSLPKFNFLGSSQATPKLTTSSTMTTSTTTMQNSNGVSGESFQFSTPVVKQAIDSALGTLDDPNVMKFTFSSPISVVEYEAATEMETGSVHPPSIRKQPDNGAVSSEATNTSLSHGSASPPVADVSTFTFKASPMTAPALKLKAVRNGAAEMVDSKPLFGSAANLKTGSVMDILLKPKSTDQPDSAKSNCNVTPVSKNSSAGFEDKFKPAAGSWECPSCMIRNNAITSNCVACETVKPVEPSKTAVKAGLTGATAPLVGFGDKFKPASGSWECSGCLLRVDKDKSKCPSCETRRPGSLTPDTIPTAETAKLSVTSSPFQGVIKASPGSWTCDTCLVRNSAKDPACVSCEVPKSGSKTVAAPGNFKFGFKTPASNVQESTTLVTTSKATFGSFSTTTPATTSSTFKFGLPASGAPLAAVASTTVPMTFGISKSLSGTTSTTSATIPSFGLAAQPPFKFGISAASVTKTAEVESLVAGFKMPSVPKTTEADKVAVATSSLTTTTTTEVTKSKTVATDDSAVRSTPAAPSFTSSGFASGPSVSFKAENVVTTTAVSTVSSTIDSPFKSSFTFGSVKPISEKPPGLLAPASSSGIGMSFAPTAAAAPSMTASLPAGATGGFRFKFSPIGVQSKPSAATDTTPAASSASTSLFSFGGQPSGANASTDAVKDKMSVAGSARPTKPEIPFSFGGSPNVGLKRNSSDVDGADSVKKSMMSPPARDTPTFGMFGAAAGKQTTTSMPEFSFGAMCQPPGAQPASGPIFGALSTTAEKSPSSSTFTFGANSSGASNPSLPAFGAASAFGAVTPKAPLQQSVWPTATQSTATPFAFNFKRSSPVTTVSSTSTAASSTFPFSFGSQPASAAAATNNTSVGVLGATPTFRAAPQPTTNKATPSFGTFGAAPNSSVTAPAFGSGATGSSTGGFTFGSGSTPGFPFGNSATPEQGVFTFTGNQNASATQIPGTGFGAGFQQPKLQQQQPQQQQQPAVAVAPSAGFSFNPSSQLNFNFGNATTGITNQPPVFSAQQNPFDVVGSASRAGRTIKKAKRRSDRK